MEQLGSIRREWTLPPAVCRPNRSTFRRRRSLILLGRQSTWAVAVIFTPIGLSPAPAEPLISPVQHPFLLSFPVTTQAMLRLRLLTRTAISERTRDTEVPVYRYAIRFT